ncbi:DUF6634 family protein [Methylobacterium sp. NPDC080182]|uniref:DUF6634 family protein n=1 Tax=Methylobacterium sp. NPDC080182 TaxID=3390590 RepID=UPI003D0568B3
MSILNIGPGPFPRLAKEAARYRRLAEDLEPIARGIHPDEMLLKDSPILYGWKFFFRPVPHLTGIVHGHPILSDGRMCYTSQLITLNPDRNYARTLSRFYRLGIRED